jgi:uncharacterized 2Fe-2S/4Fe-4S cluster protein (DUF4445 family)
VPNLEKLEGNKWIVVRNPFFSGLLVMKQASQVVGDIPVDGPFDTREEAEKVKKNLREKSVKRAAAATKVRYVAIVMRQDDPSSNRADGSWACFVDTDKDEAIKKAIEATKRYESRGNGPYDILVGSLTDKVEVPVAYELVKL